MPLYLKGKAVSFGDLILANNDIVMEIVTPASALEAKVYPDKRAMEAAANEFAKRTETPWDAFIWFLPPDKKTDTAFIASQKSYFHIHMFAAYEYAGTGTLRIEKLLPKSGHDRGDHRVNLADAPLAEWGRRVADMSSLTQIAVERFRIHYVERYLDMSRK